MSLCFSAHASSVDDATALPTGGRLAARLRNWLLPVAADEFGDMLPAPSRAEVMRNAPARIDRGRPPAAGTDINTLLL